MAVEHTIIALSHRSHENARDHGFVVEGKPHPFYRDSNLIQTETAEALEDFRNGKGLTERWYELKVTTGEGVSFTECYTPEHWRENVKRVVGPDGVERDAIPKPCGIPSELADVVIRICQRCGTDGTADLLDWRFHEGLPMGPYRDFEEFFAYVNWDVSKAFAAAHSPEVRVAFLADALRRTFDFCQAEGINLWAAIDEKEAYNRTRPYKHGKKL